MSRIARASALAVSCIALAACSAADKLTGRNARYSPKVVADGQPVPKGGGSYKVGNPYALNGSIYHPTENPNYRAEGIASWYGADFHGRLTANGEVYDMHAISAAHPTLPMPSYARVTNLQNHRSIIVRVNDRGPFARNRVIDLSIGAARALGFHDRGLARVRVEYVARAALEGSDDRMLMATLRHGSPAPAPSRVMVASAKPFVPDFGEGRGREARPALAPPGRPLVLGSTSSSAGVRQVAARATAHDAAVGQRAQARAPGRAPVGPALADAPDRAPPASSFAPVRHDAAMGLMSGRGLY